MALTVSMYWPLTAVTYSILATSVEHNFIRYPSQIAQPGNSTTKDDRVFTLDLGQEQEQIVIQGTVEVSGTPSKANLNTVCENWWTSSTTNTDLIKVIIDAYSVWYYCRVKNANFTFTSGIPDYWVFSMTLLVDSRGS